MRWLLCLATRTSQSLLWTVSNSPSLVVLIASTRARRSTSSMWALSILTLPAWRRSLLMAGRTFSASSRGTFTRTVSPLASELMTRTCSQRSLDVDAVDWLELAGAAVDWAKAPRGERTSAASSIGKLPAAVRAVLAKKRLQRSDMTGCLLTGAGPVLGDRYESAGNKVSEKMGDRETGDRETEGGYTPRAFCMNIKTKGMRNLHFVSA